MLLEVCGIVLKNTMSDVHVPYQSTSFQVTISFPIPASCTLWEIARNGINGWVP